MATEQLTDAESHEGAGAESLGVTNGKLGMWTFLVMDAMTFAGFLAGYARLRWAPDSGWPNPYETFGVVGIQLTAFNTFVLICSSVSMVHVLSETIKGNLGRARKWMVATIIGGLIFLGIQGFEWSHLIVDKWPYIVGGEAVDYNLNFAATFLSLTGFHGLHVSVACSTISSSISGCGAGRSTSRTRLWSRSPVSTGTSSTSSGFWSSPSSTWSDVPCVPPRACPLRRIRVKSLTLWHTQKKKNGLASSSPAICGCGSRCWS